MGSKFKLLKLEYLPSNQCFFTVTITLLSGQKNEDKGMISHRICMEAISTFFAKDGSNDQRIAMFPYKMDTLQASTQDELRNRACYWIVMSQAIKYQGGQIWVKTSKTTFTTTSRQVKFHQVWFLGFHGFQSLSLVT